jgi:ribosome biogenesis protein Nip4
MIDVINDLYNELLSIEELNEKIRISENVIKIAFHNEFRIEIALAEGFAVYVNDLFYVSVEEQDIFHYIKDIASDKYLMIMRKKKGIFTKGIFRLVAKESFELQRTKWQKKRNIKVISTEDTVLNNF